MTRLVHDTDEAIDYLDDVAVPGTDLRIRRLKGVAAVGLLVVSRESGLGLDLSGPRW